MKTILCILALLVLTASTADAYVRRTVGRSYVVPRYYAGNYGAYRYGLYPYGITKAHLGAARCCGRATTAGNGQMGRCDFLPDRSPQLPVSG